MKRHNFILTWLMAIFISLPVQPAFAQKTSNIGSKGKMIEFPKPKPKQTPKPKPIPKELSFEVKVQGSGDFECGRGTCLWSVDRRYSGTVNMGSSVEVLRAFAKTGNGIDYNWQTTLSEGQDIFINISDVTKETYTRKKIVKDKEEVETLSYINTWNTDNTLGKIRGVVEVIWDSEYRGFKLRFAVSPDIPMTFRRIIKPDDEIGEQFKVPVFQMPVILGCLNSEVLIPKDMSDEKTASFYFVSPPDCKTSETLLLSIPETSKVTITVTYVFK